MTTDLLDQARVALAASSTAQTDEIAVLYVAAARTALARLKDGRDGYFALCLLQV